MSDARRREGGSLCGPLVGYPCSPPTERAISSLLLFLLACGAPSEEAPVTGAPAAPAPEGAPAFEPLPLSVELLPEPRALREMLDANDLTAHVVALAAESRFKTDVLARNLSAARTGAELGNLLLEAGHADPEVTRARLARVRQGLSVFTDPALSDQLFIDLGDKLDAGMTGDVWVDHLQGRHPVLVERVQQHRRHPQLPLLLAGGWLQASWLTASALERAGSAQAAHALLYRPDVGDYFRAYVQTRGRQDFPESVQVALEETLDVMRTHTANDPMSPEDITAVRESVESLLNSM